MDEIHRFNRAQQDGFLPFVEDGTVTLVGATTENPSFELNAALLSRCQVLILRRLDHDALASCSTRAEAEADGRCPSPTDARDALIASADGDGRFLLNQAETLFAVELGRAARPGRACRRCCIAGCAVYDKDREGHYNLISALHKSDPRVGPAGRALLSRAHAGRGRGAALRAPPAGPRRVEDIGLADPQALVQCLAAKDTYDFLGSPEGELGDRPGLPLSRHRAQIERGLCRAEGGVAKRAARPAR